MQREALRPWVNRLDVLKRDRFEVAPEDPRADKERRGPIVLGSVEHVLDDPDPPSFRVDLKALTRMSPRLLGVGDLPFDPNCFRIQIALRAIEVERGERDATFV